jgi:hypothetical protein
MAVPANQPEGARGIFQAVIDNVEAVIVNPLGE